MRLSLLLCAAALLSACSVQSRTMNGMDGAPMSARTAMADSDILKVFMASNTGEILTSQPMLQGGASAEVQRYAQMMIDAHSAVNDRARALALQPRDNLVSASMTQNVTAKAAMLASMSGAVRDRKYVEAQVVLHGHTLDMLTNVLIPNAQDPALKALLAETRPAVEQHLRDAEAMFHAMPAM